MKLIMQAARFAFAFAVIFNVSALAQQPADDTNNAFQQCLRESKKTLSPNITAEQIEALCSANFPGISVQVRGTDQETIEPAANAETANAEEKLPEDLIETRTTLEKQIASNRFAILQHKNNYALPVSYSRETNEDPFEFDDADRTFSNVEFKFQLSLKFELRDQLIRDKGRLFAAYTNQSHWQLYDTENSSPFRETNHEPEIFAEFDLPYAWDTWQAPLWRIGFVHQSNGRSEPTSRSWNRLYAQLFFEKENWALSFKPWARVFASAGTDTNPDIADFLGNFELVVLRKGSKATTSALIRNNLDSDNNGALQLDWSYPIRTDNKLRFYAQFFNGYGESLIDYDFKTQRFGLGFQLTDLL